MLTGGSLGYLPNAEIAGLGVRGDLERWIVWMCAAQLSHRTILERAMVLSKFEALYGDPAKADWQMVAEFLSTPAWSASTRYTRFAQLHAFYRWLVLTGQREDDPMARLQKPKPRRGVPRPATPAQVGRVLAACNRHRTRMMVVLAICQGLRVHEIAKFRGEDLAGHSVRVLGKGGVDAVIPAHPLLEQEAVAFPARGWWFPSPTVPGRPITPGNVSKVISGAFCRAGVSGTAHNLRHYFGTQILRSSGGNLRVAQEALRHASPATTAIYTQVDDEQVRAAISGLPVPLHVVG